jgi:hypothetical protein
VRQQGSIRGCVAGARVFDLIASGGPLRVLRVNAERPGFAALGGHVVCGPV